MSFVYLERTANTPNAPLLLLLHGYGSNESDLFSFVDFIPEQYHVVSLQAPLSIGEGFAWFPIHFTDAMERWTNPEDLKKATAFIHEFISYYQKKTTFNASRIYLLGFSQGAMLSYAFGLSNNNVKGIAAMSGYLDQRVVEVSNTTIESIYVSHGTADMVVPFAWAEQSIKTLKGYGFAPEFHSYPQGHGINQDNLSSVIQWLRAQLKAFD